MADVDRRATGLTLAQAAGLRRFSARAAALAVAAPASATGAPTRSSHRNGLLSFSPLAEAVLSRVRGLGVAVFPGLSDAELARIECEFGIHLPPDLRAVLSLGLPAGPGFPDWRPPAGCDTQQLKQCRLRFRAALDVPIAAICIQVARGAFWHRSWGARPAEAARALHVARTALRGAPPLIPLFGRCYVPCRPCLAGNPVFFVDESSVFCCTLDLADFFQRETIVSFLPPSNGNFNSSPDLAFPRRTRVGTPRWIEFWSDAVCDSPRRNSSSSSPSSSSSSSTTSSASSSSSSSCSSSLELPPCPPQAFLEIRPLRPPKWVTGFQEGIQAALLDGGWDESDVKDMLYTPSPSSARLDGQAVLEALLLKAERWSDTLRRGGWRAEEVLDALGFDFWPGRGGARRLTLCKLLPETVQKVVERPSSGAASLS